MDNCTKRRWKTFSPAGARKTKLSELDEYTSFNPKSEPIKNRILICYFLSALLSALLSNYFLYMKKYMVCADYWMWNMYNWIQNWTAPHFGSSSALNRISSKTTFIFFKMIYRNLVWQKSGHVKLVDTHPYS